MQSEFAHSGFKIYRIPDDLAVKLLGFFDGASRIKFAADDCLPDYVAQGMDEHTIRNLNANHIFYGPAPAWASTAFIEFMRSIKFDVEQQLGYRWQIVNVRAWTTLPGDNDFGPIGWHTDGPPPEAIKFMLYPKPMNSENGTLEIFDRRGSLYTLLTYYPTCVLFDNPKLLHRGRPGKQSRMAIEVQTMPTRGQTETRYIYAGQNARYPRKLAPRAGWKSYIPLSIKQTIKDFIKPKAKPPAAPKAFNPNPIYLNIGGGMNYDHPGWINLDVTSNPSFNLTPDCVFPVPSGLIQTVYSSHCFEHLDDATVARVLAESRRVISKDGKLVIVIPDFEKVLERCAAGDHEFFKIWGIDSIAYTWPRAGIKDTIETRASFIFCGWMNGAWGDHFGDNVRVNEAMAYHGPAPLISIGLHELLLTKRPHHISTTLAALVRKSEIGYTFNHQNAWSRAEFCELLESSGFAVTTSEAAEVLHDNPDIPGIGDPVNISAYFEAVPK